MRICGGRSAFVQACSPNSSMWQRTRLHRCRRSPMWQRSPTLSRGRTQVNTLSISEGPHKRLLPYPWCQGKGERARSKPLHVIRSVGALDHQRAADLSARFETACGIEVYDGSTTDCPWLLNPAYSMARVRVLVPVPPALAACRVSVCVPALVGVPETSPVCALTVIPLNKPTTPYWVGLLVASI